MKKLIRLMYILVGVWAIVSFVDFAFARTMYGGMWLSKYNIVVVLYRALESPLQGFTF